MTDRTSLLDAKVRLRTRMRSLRRGLTGRPERSLLIWEHVRAVADVSSARRILTFTSIPGEPETGAFTEWARACGMDVAVPEDGVEGSWPDAVIVPALAYTARGERLGQGGGWYDRYLASVRSDCATIGVCFHEQLLDAVPVELHDVAVDMVITDRGRVAG